MKRVQFGWIIPEGPRTIEGFATYMHDVDRALALISGHFDSAWMEDHLQIGNNPQMEGWTALTYFMARHPNLFFGHAVLCQSYRNPALLAKMIATLQYLGGGRYILGLGAGWKEDEYNAYNYDFPPGHIRIDQLEEAVLIIKALWEQQPATFIGKYYSIHNAYCNPQPNPCPPLTIGARKSHMLSLAVKYADWWDIASISANTYQKYVASIERICREANRDPQTLQRSCWFDICACRPTETAAKALLRKSREQEAGFIGTPAQITEQIYAYIELGVNRFEIGCTGFPDLTSLELFISEVLPNFK